MASDAGAGAAIVKVASSPLPRMSFSTEAFAPEHRFEAWQALIGRTHDVAADPQDFRANLQSIAVGPMLVGVMNCLPQTVARTPRRLRNDGQDHLVLHLTSASFAFETTAATRDVPAGCVTVNTLSRPFQRSRAPERGSVVISLARDLVAETVPDPEVFHGAVLQDGVGLLLADHMGSLARSAGQIRADQAQAVADATVRLLAASLGAGPSAAADAIDAALLLRCRRYIERHLASPSLSPEVLCRAVGVSRSSLYRLFERHGGVAAFIRRRRLIAAHVALARGEARRVSEVAQRFGFTNDAVFRRAYRATFGSNPSEAGRNLPLGASAPGDSLFTEWLSTFG